MISGMRPLFKTVKAHEATTVRPFEDEHISARGFCRIRQWGPIWQITAEPVDPPDFLRQLAVEQASILKPISPLQVARYFKSMPRRAHGADGWSIEMLKQLNLEECQTMVQLFHRIEQSGDIPNQWKVAMVVMLPKAWDVERPIALLHTVYKSLLKLRWALIEEWLPVVREKMPWDAALPGNATADVAIKRVMRCEVSRVRGKHHVTLYMDLSAFYEHIEHHALIHQALDLCFPPLPLYWALSVYQGPRLILVDGVASPTFAAKRGVLAGDPIAPLLAKVALYKPLQEILSSSAVHSADVWVDDISLDVEEDNAGKAAHNAFNLYQRLKHTLILAGHKPSDPKTFFLASTAKAARALNQLRQEGDPEVKQSGLDLGMATSAGRARTFAGQRKRLAKAGKRLQKLRSLKVPVTRKKVRVYSASIVAAGIWGHQSQGISPKVQKTLRMQAGNMVHLQKLGSVDIVLDLQESNIKDPAVEIVVQHWKTVSKVLAKGDDAQWICRTWQVLWSRLRDRDRWKRVAGPIGALVAYLHDLKIEASNLYEWRHQEEVVHPFRQACSLQAVAAFLRRVAVKARRVRISLQDNAQDLLHGIDWTVPRKILKKCLTKSRQASHYRTAWQGALLTTHKSRERCPKCGAVANIRHILYECPWWQDQDSHIPSHWEGINDIPEITWTRGLVPAQLTALPSYSYGEESLRIEGRWLEPFPDQNPELVYGTDASGGGFSEDPRLRVVSWAAIVGVIADGRLNVLGKASGRLPPGSSIAQGEASALVFILSRVGGPLRVLSDSKAAISQAESKSFRPSMHPVWDHLYPERDRLLMEWIKSHQSCEDFVAAHGQSQQWKWELNNQADILCGQRSAEVDVAGQAKLIQRVDKIAFEINHFLHDRVRQLFTSGSTPLRHCSRRPRPARSKVIINGPQNRPALDGGLNKKERMQLMIDSGRGGHQFERTRKTSVNWAIACKKCRLYQEQVHSLQKFSRIEQQTCAHQPMAWPDRWHLGQGHDMYNLGAVWICRRCWGIVRPPADEVSSKLLNTCTGHTSNGSKKFGLLLPKECPVAFSVPQQLKPVQVQHAVQHHTQQSKLRLFFGNSVRKPREEVVSPSADKSRASSSDLTAQSCPLGRAQLRVRAEFDQEEVPSPPNNNQDGEAVQGGPVKVGQRQRQPRKRTIQASPECLPGGRVQGTGNVAICSGAAQDLQVDFGQEQKAARSSKAKGAVAPKTERKRGKDGSKSSTRPSVPTSGPRTSKRCSEERREETKRSKSESPSLTDEETEEEDEEGDEEVPSPREASQGPENVDKAEQAAMEEASSSATGAVGIQEVSSEDEDAQPMDPLEPWQRRMVSKKLAQCKEEVATTPGGTDLGYHLLIPAVPNRRRPVKPHHWTSRKALLCQAPWGLSAGINGPRTLPAEILYEGQGRNRVVYSVPGASQSERPSVLKLVSDDEGHGREMEAYLRLPLLCAKVFWQGRVGVKWPNDLDRGITTMNALVQSQCTLAIKWLKPRRGKDIANQFCVYCMVVMQFVRLSGFALCDCGEHNLAVSDLSATPLLQFIDMQEWKDQGDPEYLTGFLTLVKQFAPDVERLIVQSFRGDKAAMASRALPGCQTFHSNLRDQGVLSEDGRFIPGIQHAG